MLRVLSFNSNYQNFTAFTFKVFLFSIQRELSTKLFIHNLAYK